MRKDIEIPKVEDIAMAVIPETLEDGTEEWYAYILNLKKVPIETVLISSKGYRADDGKKRQTSDLRQHFELILPRDWRKIELIPEELFTFSNEFWVSFYEGGKLYDKKFVFVPESLSPELMTTVPIIDKKGVLIKS